MVKCFFCGIEYPEFQGLSLIKNDGSIQHFCSGKCRKNTFNLRRDKRKVKWTEAFRLKRGKTLEKAKRV